MKKYLIVCITLICIILSLLSCTTKEETVPTPISNSESNDLFTLTIYADSDKYKKDTKVDCYATLKYVGDEPITVYHSDPMAVFIIEDDKYFPYGYGGIRQDVLINTTFEPNEEIRLEFQKNGGWSADDPNVAFYEEFYNEKDLILPKGEYKLSVNLRYSLDEDKVVETIQSLNASINILVK